MDLRTVLLVDDEPEIRMLAKLALEKVGRLRIFVASSCAEALEVALRERPDVVLLDVMMPDGDGPATLARLRATPELERVPIVFLTGRVEPEEVERLQALGAVGVLRKPFDPMTLARELRALVGADAG